MTVTSDTENVSENSHSQDDRNQEDVRPNKSGGRRHRSTSLHETYRTADFARESDDYPGFIRWLRKYRRDWEGAENREEFIPPGGLVSKVPYGMTNPKIAKKLTERMIPGEETAKDIDWSLMTPPESSFLSSGDYNRSGSGNSGELYQSGSSSEQIGGRQ